MIRLGIKGAPRTKKNGGNLIMRGGKRVRTNSDAFNVFEASALWQLRAQWHAEPITEPVNLWATFYIDADRVVDTCGLYQGLADILVKAKVLADDNRRILASWDGSRVYVDRKMPRVEIVIVPA